MTAVHLNEKERDLILRIIEPKIQWNSNRYEAYKHDTRRGNEAAKSSRMLGLLESIKINLLNSADTTPVPRTNADIKEALDNMRLFRQAVQGADEGSYGSKLLDRYDAKIECLEWVLGE